MFEEDCVYFVLESQGCDNQGADVNADGAINVIDIISVVNHILGEVLLDDCGFATADMDGNGAINVLDIISIVSEILGGKTAADATEATLIQSGGSLLLLSLIHI